MTDWIIEADGGSRGNPGPAAWGTVVRDGSDGSIDVERAGYLGIATNNVAEYTGLISGLEAIAEKHGTDGTVQARLDSKLVVEQMSGRWKIKHPDIRELAMRARSVYPPENVSYEWVPREHNKAADALVNECLDSVAAGGTESIDR